MNKIEIASKGLWYFAHPYTCRDKDGSYVPEGEEANFNICNMRAAELLIRGYNVYAPISHTHPIHRACPIFLAQHEHDIWYKLDNEVIARTDWNGIILAPKWGESGGCKAEYDWFLSHKRRDGKPHEILKYSNLIGD